MWVFSGQSSADIPFEPPKPADEINHSLTAPISLHWSYPEPRLITSLTHIHTVSIQIKEDGTGPWWLGFGLPPIWYSSFHILSPDFLLFFSFYMKLFWPLPSLFFFPVRVSHFLIHGYHSQWIPIIQYSTLINFNTDIYNSSACFYLLFKHFPPHLLSSESTHLKVVLTELLKVIQTTFLKIINIKNVAKDFSL